MQKKCLDHFAVAVHDVQNAGEIYGRLGFQALPVARHEELGTCNRVIQLHDTYLELVGDFEKAPPLLRDLMLPRYECGEGLAIVSLTAEDLNAETMRMRRTRWVPAPIVNARRRLTLPDGSIDETDSRCVYVWRRDRIYSSLFFSEHRKPHTIWIPEYQRHENTAVRVGWLTYRSLDPLNDAAYAADMLGYGPELAGPDRVTFRTPRGEVLEYVSPRAAAEQYGSLAPLECSTQPCLGIALGIEVRDLAVCAEIFNRNGVAYEAREGAVRVGADQAHGVVLVFRQG